MDQGAPQEAVSSGHIEIVRFLLGRGARLDGIFMGEAIEHRYEEMVSYLLGEGMMPDDSSIKEAERWRQLAASPDDRRRSWRIQKLLLGVAAERAPTLFWWAKNMDFGLGDEEPGDSDWSSDDDDGGYISSDSAESGATPLWRRGERQSKL